MLRFFLLADVAILLAYKVGKIPIKQIYLTLKWDPSKYYHWATHTSEAENSYDEVISTKDEFLSMDPSSETPMKEDYKEVVLHRKINYI